MTEDYTLRRAEPKDYEDIIDFGNYVFKTDFTGLLPKLYLNHPERAAEHVLVTEKRENGERIRAMVGGFLIRLSVAGQPLLARGIGTVSVHPYDRGKGYMKLAMHKVIDDAVAEGVDLLLLSGRKQRYQHYGFEKCAAFYRFILIPSVSEQLRKYGVEGITSPVPSGKIEILIGEKAAKYEDECRRLYSSQPVYAERKNFTEIASSWRSGVDVLVENGKFIGYAVLGNAYGQFAVNELILVPDVEKDLSRSINAVLTVLDEAVKTGAGSVEVKLLPFQTELIRTLTLIAEQGSVEGECGIDVINYASVVQAYLQVKAYCEPVEDGSYVFSVPGKTRVKIEVKDGKVAAHEVDDTFEADIELSHLQMMNFLFAPTGRIGICGKKPELEKSWFPIPVCFSEQDNS